MPEASVNSEQLSLSELVRFASRSKDLVDRTRAIASSEAINIWALSEKTGLSYSWVRRFVEGSASNEDITKVSTLYLALVGESTGR